ncbi:hypothetical protein JCM10212_006729 [Sporobolomyces blumeae]
MVSPRSSDNEAIRLDRSQLADAEYSGRGKRSWLNPNPLPRASNRARYSALGRPRPEHKAPSLALLPRDILCRIADFLEPTISPFRLDRNGPSHSSTWTRAPNDLIRLSSTCRAIYDATRPFVWRKVTVRRSIESRRENEYRFESGSRACSDERASSTRKDDRNLPHDEVCERKREVEACMFNDDLVGDGCTTHAVSYLGRAMSWSPGTLGRGETIRYLAFDLSKVKSLLVDDGHEFFVTRLEDMKLLRSVAFVYKDEDWVVATTPYDVAPVPFSVVRSLSQLDSIVELYLCGIDIVFEGDQAYKSVEDRARMADFGQDAMFGPSFESLTLNACADSALILPRLCPHATTVQIWRDFGAEPSRVPEGWWNEESWFDVKHLEITGLGGSSGRELFDAWVASLFKLRDPVHSAPPTIPLHTLRLPEPFRLDTLETVLLPALRGLPHLRSFTTFVWNDRNFSPKIVDKIVDALPELEELGFGLENEGLNWWFGDLREWFQAFSRLSSLHTLTWNYTPYTELSYDEMRKHVLRPLRKALDSAFSSNPDTTRATSPADRTTTWGLERVRWFGTDSELVRWRVDGVDEWRWRDEVMGKVGLPEWGIVDLTDEERIAKEDTDPLRGLEPVSNASDSPDRLLSGEPERAVDLTSDAFPNPFLVDSGIDEVDDATFDLSSVEIIGHGEGQELRRKRGTRYGSVKAEEGETPVEAFVEGHDEAAGTDEGARAASDRDTVKVKLRQTARVLAREQGLVNDAAEQDAGRERAAEPERKKPRVSLIERLQAAAKEENKSPMSRRGLGDGAKGSDGADDSGFWDGFGEL